MESRVEQLEKQVAELQQSQADLIAYYETIAKQMVQGFKVYDEMFKVRKKSVIHGA